MDTSKQKLTRREIQKRLGLKAMRFKTKEGLNVVRLDDFFNLLNDIKQNLINRYFEEELFTQQHIVEEFNKALGDLRGLR